MTRTSDITSFTDHRQHLRAHFEQVRTTGRPMFVTTNGRTDAVILSPDQFDQLCDKAAMADGLGMIEQSLEDMQRGDVRDARQALQDIAQTFGLDLDS